jgi:thiosulfate/3-mercaptopyruvate sulfurtransferase
VNRSAKGERGGENIKVKVLMAAVVLLALSMSIPQGFACVEFQPGNVPPIVTTNWLEDNLYRKNLVVLDVRDAGSYSAGHIPGAINVPEAEWYVNDPFTVPVETPWMELPSVGELFSMIGNAGITSHSVVVVVGSTGGPLSPVPLALYSTTGIARVAITLLYAGIRNVAILDGGHDKWVADGYPTESGTITPTPVKYNGIVKSGMFVSMQYVNSRIGKSIIVDSRDPEVYNCSIGEPWAAYNGHIPTARNMPAPSLWNVKADGEGLAVYITYKDIGALKKIASDVIGRARCRDIIVYCGVGGYESTVYFVLSRVLGYDHVKLYDGSAQEWTQAGMPVEC